MRTLGWIDRLIEGKERKHTIHNPARVFRVVVTPWAGASSEPLAIEC